MDGQPRVFRHRLNLPVRTPLLLIGIVLSLGVGAWAGHAWTLRSATGLDARTSVFFMPWDGMRNENPDAKEAATRLLRGIQTRDVDDLRAAKVGFKALEKMGDIGGEYGAMTWFSTYLAAGEAGREAMDRDPIAARLVRYFEVDKWSRLQDYLERKYRLLATKPYQKPGRGDGASHRTLREGGKLRMLDELVRFSGPTRMTWERSDLILDRMGIGPGDHIADIGAGSGYFSFLFAERVGPEGRVVALDLNRNHLAYVAEVAEKEGFTQIEIVETDGTEVGAPESTLDFVFMCATYQAIYAFEREKDRTALLDNVRATLKADGRLVIVDNSLILPEGIPPYKGILIAKDAVIGQLKAHGFKLLDQGYSVPQRFVLVFGVDD
jgi:ubiquinone/menaquinone biosynthesis C-methylase UbiE